MYLSQLSIEGYKGIGKATTVTLHEGLNVIVGENASGKTTIIDAIRLLLKEDEFGYAAISEGDFHRTFSDNSKPSEYFLIKGTFAGLSSDDKVTFLPWYDLNNHADLSIRVENSERMGRFKRKVWGGAAKSSAFEWELFDKISCIYLPPLRDAEEKLKEGKSSRLGRLLKNLEASAIKSAKKTKTLHNLESKMKKFNYDLSQDASIQNMNEKIRSKLKEAVGEVFGQDTHVSFSEVGFNRIAESLRLFFFPDVNGSTEKSMYRSLDENSLGHNNLLYLATVLAELINSGEEDERVKVLLVEEPEAHLHPQLQVRLLKYLEEIAETDGIQVIVTSHSPILASSTSIDNIIHIASNDDSSMNVVPINKTGIDLTISLKNLHDEIIEIPASKMFLSRWLDAMKSNLLFAKGVVLVEGIAEVFLIPKMAERILKEYNNDTRHEIKLSPRLDKSGVSVVNMNGIYFNHFMRLFCNFGDADSASLNITIRCSGITDMDPEKESRPTKSNPSMGKNPAIKLMSAINASPNCRLFISPLKTFEYDLAMEGENIKLMAKVLADNWHNKADVYNTLNGYANKDWSEITDDEKSNAAFDVLNRIEDSNMGKGYFAQLLSESIIDDQNFKIPKYIYDAVIWACGGKSD